jgi:hypothetical protein
LKEYSNDIGNTDVGQITRMPLYKGCNSTQRGLNLHSIITDAESLSKLVGEATRATS